LAVPNMSNQSNYVRWSNDKWLYALLCATEG